MKTVKFLIFISLLASGLSSFAESNHGYRGLVDVAVIPSADADRVARVLAESHIRAVLIGSEAQTISVAPEQKASVINLLKSRELKDAAIQFLAKN